MSGKGQNKKPRGDGLFLISGGTELESNVLGPPSQETVLNGIKDAAFRKALSEGLFREDAEDIASTVMLSAIEPLASDPWFLSNAGKRVTWARLGAERRIINREIAAEAEEARETYVTYDIELNRPAFGDTQREMLLLDFDRSLELVDALLSDREREVLDLARDGHGPSAIAEEIGSTPNSVSQDLQRIYAKFRVAMTGTNKLKRGEKS